MGYCSLILDGFEEFCEIERNFVFRRIYDSWPALILAGKSSEEFYGPKGTPASSCASEKILMEMCPFDEPDEIKDMFKEVVVSQKVFGWRLLSVCSVPPVVDNHPRQHTLPAPGDEQAVWSPVTPALQISAV